MPYTKRRYRRNGRGRKLSKREKAEVKKLIAVRQELKFFLSQTNARAVTNSPVIFQITNIPQGVADTDRTGDRLYLKKAYVRLHVAIGDFTNMFRIIFFQWKPNTVPAISGSDILLPGASGSIDYLSQYNHDNRQEFRILYDRTYNLNGNGSGASDPITSTSQVIKFIKLRPKLKQLQYAGGSTVGTNQVYYLAISDSSILPNPTFSMSVKFLYTDS